MNELNAKDTYLTFCEYEAFQNFLEKMNSEDQWICVEGKDLKVNNIDAGEIPQYIYKDATPEQIDAAYRDGALYAEINAEKFLLNDLALFTLNDRAGITSRYTKAVSQEEPQRLVDLLNIALPYWKNKVKCLVRGGQIMAAHSDNYIMLPQNDVFSISKKLMQARFPDAKFKNANYSHVQSEMTFSLCDHKDAILAGYMKSWLAAGYAQSALEKSHPMFSIRTSDIGMFCLEILPQLFVHTAEYPLGEPIKIKHNGSASLKELEHAMDLAYASLNDGLQTVSDMLETELSYPVEAFTGACKQVGMHKFCKKLLKKMIEEFSYSFCPGETMTAYAVYSSICEIKYSNEYKAMSAGMKLKVDESIYRLLKVDWLSVDRVGITL